MNDETNSSITINFPSLELDVKLSGLELNNKLNIWIASMMKELSVHMLHTEGLASEVITGLDMPTKDDKHVRDHLEHPGIRKDRGERGHRIVFIAER